MAVSRLLFSHYLHIHSHHQITHLQALPYTLSQSGHPSTYKNISGVHGDRNGVGVGVGVDVDAWGLGFRVRGLDGGGWS